MLDFFLHLFDTSDFPARWHCGNWSTGHGFLHIGSDLAIFGAYMAIPLLLTYALRRSPAAPTALPRIVGLFIAFVACCGITHLNEAIIFWEPIYRFAGLSKLVTAVVSWGTVLALAPALPTLLTMRSPETVRQEAALREAEAQLRDLYDNAPDMYATVDMDKGRLVRCNATMLRALGYSADDLLALDLTALHAPACHPGLAETLDTFRQEGHVADVELALRKKDGSTMEVSLSLTAMSNEVGGARFGRAAWRDISERKRAEALFELAVEASPSGMIVVDHAGKVVLANAEAERLFGYSREEMVGQPVEMMVPTETRSRHPELRETFARQPEARAMGAGRQLHAQRKDGSQFPVEVGLNPIESHGQKLTLSAIVDRSELVEKQRRLVEHTRALQRSNEELEQFAYVASHDLQEPLRMVSSFSQLLARRYRGQLDAQADEYIHFLVDGAKRMQGLINDLLAYSRVSRPSTSARQMVDVDAIVARVLVSLRIAIQEAHAEVVYKGLPSVYGDPGQLTQVFQNLIGNAVKFRGPDRPRVVISIDESPEAWEVCVADNGIGIAKDHVDRIFEMFQRLHERERYEGSGIGLAMVKKIIERHGGRIWVDSEEGMGSAFRFTLPRPTEGAGPDAGSDGGLNGGTNGGQSGTSGATA